MRSRRLRSCTAVLALPILLAACGALRSSPPRAAGATAAVPAPARQVLGNGVVLIVQEHRAADVVAVQLWMRVGGRDESADELGLSHYLEHMLFKGTPTRPPGSIDALLEGLGGTSNAFTSYDYTHFDVVVPAADLGAAMDVLADISVNASFDPTELESEKKVVFEEMNLVEDDPEKFLTRRLGEIAYAPHPYGRPILGTRELVKSLDRPRLAAYYHKHYVPRNMALVVVGPVVTADVRAQAERSFGRLQGAAAERASSPAIPSLAGGRRDDVTRPEQQAYLGMAWDGAAARGNADIFAVDLLTYILGDGPTSRLNQTLRERLGLVATIDASYVTREQSGIVSVTARLDAANLERAEAAVLDVLRGIRASGVTEAERARAVITAESNYAFDVETAEGLAKSYGTAETTSSLEDELQYLARLRETTAAQIQAAAQKYFGDDNYARVRFVPGAR
jgi:zinc protease